MKEKIVEDPPGALPAGEEPRDRIMLLYQSVDTNAGSDLYGHVTCLRQDRKDGGWRTHRKSSPFVVARRYGGREVVPGSAYQLVKNFGDLFAGTAGSIRRGTRRLERMKGTELARAYCNYEREVTQGLVLLACLARNLFHLFSRLTEQYTVQVFDYDNRPMGEIRTKVLLDLFVHSRYMNLHNEYITDLFSADVPKGTPISQKFMGYRFRVADFMDSIYRAVHGITLKDLITRLRGGMQSLSGDMPHHEMVFLIQNVHSFSNLLGAKIPTEEYDFMMHLLFDDMEPDVGAANADGMVRRRVVFKEPGVSIAGDLSEKQFRINVRCHVADNDARAPAGVELKARTVEVGFAEFLEQANRAFGAEALHAIGPEREAIRARGAEGLGGGTGPVAGATDRTRRRHPTKKRRRSRKR